MPTYPDYVRQTLARAREEGQWQAAQADAGVVLRCARAHPRLQGGERPCRTTRIYPARHISNIRV